MSADNSVAIDNSLIRVKADDGAEADLIITRPSNAQYGVLWLPAMGVSARHYQMFASALAEHGIASAVHEWRGAGSSSLRASRVCDWGYHELLHLDIPASLAAARRCDSALDWIVGGHSLGGQLAALFAAMNPDQVSALALVATGSPWWRTFSGRMRHMLRVIPWIVGAVTSLTGYYPGKRLGFAGRESRGVMRDWARTTREGCYADYASGADSEQALARLAKPVLGVRLDEDSFCPEASLRWLLEKFVEAPIERKHLNATDFQSATADHFSWLKDPGPVVRALVEWMNSRLPHRG